MTHRVAVIGSGSWGTAAAGLVARHADEVCLWAHSAQVADGINANHANPRYLTSYELPANVSSSTSLEESAAGADELLVAVPSSHLRDVCGQLAGTVPAGLPVLVLTKGMELGSGKLMSDVVADELGDQGRVAVLSGPNHAEEVCRNMISAAVVASTDAALAERFQRLVINPAFRVYITDDMVGVEVCGAVKNVIAIACGAAVGMGAGDNTLAVIMTRGLAEVGRVVRACGGKPMTCMGLAGMGDLVATCTSRHSRNRSFGEALVSGRTLEEYESETHMVVEGARAAVSVHDLATQKAVEAPITAAVNGILHEGVPVGDAIDSLLGRLPREEFYGLGIND